MGYHDIVIIDNGVNGNYFNGIKLKYNLEVGPGLEILERQETEDTDLSHGTICAAILSKYAPGAVLSSIKVVDSKMHLGSSRQLEAALRWCLERKEPMLISLSIGTVQSQDFDRLRVLLSGLYRKGSVIIAAYDNRFRYTVPASLECVVGVRRGVLAGDGCAVRTDGFEVYAEARSRHQLVTGSGREMTTPAFNSFAAPYVAALVHNGLPEGFLGGIWDIWTLLGGEVTAPFCYFPDFLDSAAVVDLDGGEWPDLFFFETEIVEDGENGLQYLEGNQYIVILAQSTECLRQEAVAAALEKENIRGVFCCWEDGRIGEKLPRSLNRRVWQEGYYLEKYRTCKDVGEIAVPVVYLYGERKRLTMLLQDLGARFREEGYHVQTAGQFPRAYLYGFAYIDSTRNRRAILYNIYKRFDCDILLCGIASKEEVHDVEDVSFRLWQEEPVAEKEIFGKILDLFL